MKRTIVSQPGMVLPLIAATIGGKSLAAWVTCQFCLRWIRHWQQLADSAGCIRN
jgi:hypothetical protein